YTSRRRVDREQTLAFSTGLAQLTSNRSPLLRPLRSIGLLAASHIGGLQALLVSGAMGFRGEVPHLCRNST
ncbi:MAG TPA: 2-octaprenyl-6-methoxyphenyl hydroxylase, partial [Xylella taiwanensis]